MKTWEDWANEVESGCVTRGLTIKGIEAYKQSLKAEVEKEIAFLEPSSHNQMFRGTLESHKRFLQLIETVKPNS